MTKYDEIQRSKEKLVNSVVGLSPHLSRVSIRWSDIEKIMEWEQMLIDKGENTLITMSKPFLRDTFYVLENADGTLLGIRFQYVDGVHKFANYIMKEDRKVPAQPQFVFNMSDVQDISMKADRDAVKGNLDIISNTYYSDSVAVGKAHTAVNLWGTINHFMVNFERDIQVILYKNKTQGKGTGKRGRNTKTITSKIYRCYLPDNWVARNEKEYTTPKWDIPGHWHRQLVNEDFLERKSQEMTEEELNEKHRLSSDQNPMREGKIYIDFYRPDSKGQRSEHLLSENHRGMKPTDYRI
jgi:hypothetical protein